MTMGECLCVILTCFLGLYLCIVLIVPRICQSVLLKRLRYRFSKNAVKGYKGFCRDMTCQGMQYRQNEEFIQPGSPRLCCQGFHFCPRLSDVFDYYNDDTDVYCPVTAFGAVAGSNHEDKRCTDAIRIGRLLTPPEIYAILLQENSMLPKDHQIIELVYSRMIERGYFHRRLNLLLKWQKRAESYMERNSLGKSGNRKTVCKPPKGVVRIGGRLRRA